MPTLHVSFNMSSAHCIRQALQSAGYAANVLGFMDDLSFGPIDASTSPARTMWVGDVVGFEWSEVVQDAAAFWREVRSNDASLVAWVNRRDSAEYCGLLEFIDVVGQKPFSMIDATDIEFTSRQEQNYLARTLGIVPPEQMVRAGLPDRARTAEVDEIESYRRVWTRLKAENAPLRIVAQGRLISAPIDHFDDWLVRYSTDEWQKGTRIVGQAMWEIFSTQESPHVSDIWLWGRVCALADEGVLETVGDTSEMRGTMVRRPAGGCPRKALPAPDGVGSAGGR